jgi:small subunit ribosomal protein S17
VPKRVLQGTVVSDKPDKSVVVSVERRVMHPIYKKFIRRSKRYMAHDEGNQFKVGDQVRIVECRPLSARKRWQVLLDQVVDATGAPTGALPEATTPETPAPSGAAAQG